MMNVSFLKIKVLISLHVNLCIKLDIFRYKIDRFIKFIYYTNHDLIIFNIKVWSPNF